MWLRCCFLGTTDAWLFKDWNYAGFFKRINGEKKKLTDIGLGWFSFRTVGPVGFLGLVFSWSFSLDIGLIDY